MAAGAGADESSAPVTEEAAPASATATRWADRCTNFTTNGWAFKAPRNFLQWLDVFSDPGVHQEFARRSLDPQYLLASLDSLLDPGTPRNYLEWSNPDLYVQWARAAADPEFYTAVNGIVFDPGRLMRWIMLPVDGKTWELAGTVINPATWMKWLNTPNAPEAQSLFAKAVDPGTARRWLEALGDPNNAPWLHPAPRPAPTPTSNPATRMES
jgi:hypothetical protein